jgi:hypothetical protein
MSDKKVCAFNRIVECCEFTLITRWPIAKWCTLSVPLSICFGAATKLALMAAEKYGENIEFSLNNNINEKHLQLERANRHNAIMGRICRKGIICVGERRI